MNQRINTKPLLILYNKFRLINPFGSKTPVHLAKETKPFFIIGSGRSGTTLLRSMLTQSSRIEIPPESYVLPIIYKRYITYNRLPWPEFVKLILGEFASHPLFKYWNLDISPLYHSLIKTEKKYQSLRLIIDCVYQLYAAKNGKETVMWGDKTPLNTYYIKELDLLFNQPKYIHLKRDGRDVVASMLKYKLAENLQKACDRWLDSIQAVEKLRSKSPDRVIEIRYEDLVSKPESTIREVCNFLSIDFDQKILKNTASVGKLGDDVFEHHDNLKQEINTKSIGKWRNDLSSHDIEWIHEYMGDTLIKEGYEL